MRKHIFVFLLLLPAFAFAQVYRWVDESGKVQYSDKPPPPNAKNVQKKSMSGGATSSAPLPFALQEASRNFPVTLYTNEECKDICVQARDLLNKRGVPYKEINIEDKQELDDFKKLTGGSTVPVLLVGRDMQKGYESSLYQAALDAAGYPRNSVLPPGAQARQLVKKPVKKAVPDATAAAPETSQSEAAPADTSTAR